ncbi:hypothetical protein Ancab_038750 [Ancistrocladus abbreviatus]
MASNACNSETLNFPYSPNKRLKSQTQTLTSPISPSWKGKRPIEEPNNEHFSDDDGDQSPIDDDAQPRSCGICFSEGTAIRGCIDSCEHYFCFFCIIEWSKIESRCPMCKRRFSSIRRMRRDGSFISDRAVNVPARDQIYHPLGNMSTGNSDPYSDVKCSVCQGATDENLLLLCDLCDTAVHTYCTGLGATVPEGDWFCQDCVLVRAEQMNNEIGGELCIPSTSGNLDNVESTQAPVSIFDIVREPREPRASGLERLLRLVNSNPSRSSSSAVVLDMANHDGDSGNGPGTALSSISMGEMVESDARALHRCRNVHKHIKALHENWTDLQCGTASFSSDIASSGKVSSTRATATYGDEPDSLASTSSSQPRPQGSSTCGRQERYSHNIDRAWKMFKIAKSMEQAQNRSQTFSPAPKMPVGKVNASKSSKDLDVHHLASKSVAFGTKHLYSAGLQIRRSYRKLNVRHQFQGPEKEQNISTKLNGITTYCSPRNSLLLSSQKLHPSIEADLCCNQANIASKLTLNRVLSNNCNQQGGSACPTYPTGSVSRVSDIPPVKLGGKSLPSINIEFPAEKAREDNSHSGSSSRKDDGAKSEIQSLVRLNLKILTRDKAIGSDTFKDIARRSTHKILAACGLEHRGTLAGPSCTISTVCSHNDRNQQHCESTLMPGFCRECFYVFVMDAVKSTMSEKLGHLGPAK